MNVLSLFDGISCGQVALQRAGIAYDNYYASEIDKYAIQITQKNFPNTIQLGDVKQVWARNLPKIDLLIGGSPCQDLSIAKNNRQGLKGARSGLFWHYVRLLRTCKPKYFMLENVASMPKEAKAIITKELGVEPILINSALVSAQQRKRLYWTNIPNIPQPKDKGIFFKDILEKGSVLKLKSRAITCYIGRTTTREYFKKHQGELIPCALRNRGEGKKPEFNGTDKANSLTTVQTDSVAFDFEKNSFRLLTPVECERLQTLPDNYTAGISNTQRYKCLGNGWTVDVIAHIFKFMRGFKNNDN